MGSMKLKEDLRNCIITFDRRVLITDLLDDYKMAYEEVNNILVNYLEEQNTKNKLKYEKKYLVHGEREGETKKEIYKIVEEQKLNEWLKKLKNAESSLYSVEVAGGAKAVAPVFKPIKIQDDVKIKIRQGANTATANGFAESSKTSTAEKSEIKRETEKPLSEDDNTKTVKESPKKFTKKTPLKKESSPIDNKKSTDKKPISKKGINNFFAPSSSTSKKAEENKDVKSPVGVIKPPTPKKMQDFFKKQNEKSKSSAEALKKSAVNTSVQLFDDEEEQAEEEESSDEEEKLEALKRDIITSDVEMGEQDYEADSKPTTSSKRRRIVDSDDEDENLPVKQEKLDIKEEEEEAEQQSETYLDEEGFVITKKPKQKARTKSPATKKTPPVTIKTSPKENKNNTATTKKDTKGNSNPPAKTKQAGIMNFFSKK